MQTVSLFWFEKRRSFKSSRLASLHLTGNSAVLRLRLVKRYKWRKSFELICEAVVPNVSCPDDLLQDHNSIDVSIRFLNSKEFLPMKFRPQNFSLTLKASGRGQIEGTLVGEMRQELTENVRFDCDRVECVFSGIALSA